MMSPEDLRDEQARMTHVRLVVDATSYRLRFSTMTREESLALIEQARETILELCPRKEEVFDLILRARFMRLLDERAMAAWGVMDSMN